MVPIREYLCEKCGKAFEFLAMNGHDKVECPKCHSTKLKRKLSVFAAGRSESSGAFEAPMGGECGPDECHGPCADGGSCMSQMN